MHRRRRVPGLEWNNYASKVSGANDAHPDDYLPCWKPLLNKDHSAWLYWTLYYVPSIGWRKYCCIGCVNRRRK